MAGLVYLPQETIQHIISFLPGSAVKSLRASCKVLCNSSSPWLFPVLYLSNHPLDLQVFQLVLANPTLSGHVRELVIDDTCLAPSLADQQNYISMAKREEMFWSNRRKAYFPEDEPFPEKEEDQTLEPKQEFFDLFVNTMEPHHKNLKANADIVALRYALPKLTGVERLVLTNRTADESPERGAQSQQSSSPTVRQWRGLGRQWRERPPFPPRCDWFSGWGPICRDEAWAAGEVFSDELARQISEGVQVKTSTEEGVQEDADDQESESGEREVDESEQEDGASQSVYWYPFTKCVARETRGLHVALIALSEPLLQSRLVEFRIDPSEDIIQDEPQPDFYHVGLSHSIFSYYGRNPFPNRIIETLGSCSNLQRLQLSISNGYGETQGREIMECGEVARVMDSMSGLQDISLEFPFSPSWLAIPKGKVYPSLRRFAIKSSEVWPKDLLAFMRRHMTTLEEFLVEDCSVNPEEICPSWSDEQISDLEMGNLPELVQDIKQLAEVEGSRLLPGKVMLSRVSGSISQNGCGQEEIGNDWPRWARGSYSWVYGSGDILDFRPM